MLHFDPINAYALSGAGALVGASMMLLLEPDDAASARSLQSFSLGFLVFGVGLFQLAFADAQPSALAMLWAMESIAIGTAFFGQGIAQIEGCRLSPARFGAICVGMAVAIALAQQVGMRAYSTVLCIACLTTGVVVHAVTRGRLLHRPRDWAERALGIALVVYTGSWALRLVLGVTEPEPLDAHILLMPDALIPWFSIFYCVLPVLLASLVLNLANARLHARLRAVAFTDDLTGLLTRRALHDCAPSVRARAARNGGAPAVLMVDLDHFKQINDDFGHAVGDATLAAAAEACRQSLRADALLARYGGEELVGLLVADDADSAMAAAERVRAAVEAVRVSTADGKRVPVTASVGVALWNPTCGLEHALRCADQALYQAKAAGRNRVVAHAS